MSEVTHSKDDQRLTWPGPLLDIACTIAAQKWVVIGIILIGTIIGILRLLTLDPVYTASAVAVLLPREKPMLDATIETSSMESSNDSAGRSSVGTLMLPANPTLYTTLINSRTVLSEIAEKFKIDLGYQVSPKDRSDEVIQQVKSMLKVTSTEDGMITITVKSNNPKLSSDIANELFNACKRASKAIERSLILQQAVHLEEALVSAQRHLSKSEKELSVFAAKYGLVDVGLQASNTLRSIREIETEKKRLEADLSELLLSYSERSPEARILKTRIKTLEAQRAGSGQGIVGSTSEEEYGQLIVSYNSLQQTIRFERDLVATLSTKTDIYRIRAEQPTGNLAIIRPASPPNRPAGPSKKKEIGLALGLSVFLAIGWALMRQQWMLATNDPELNPKIEELKNALLPHFIRKHFLR